MGPSHYEEAERLLGEYAAEKRKKDPSPFVLHQSLREAKVHAILAMVDAQTVAAEAVVNAY